MEDPLASASTLPRVVEFLDRGVVLGALNPLETEDSRIKVVAVRRDGTEKKVWAEHTVVNMDFSALRSNTKFTGKAAICNEPLQGLSLTDAHRWLKLYAPISDKYGDLVHGPIACRALLGSDQSKLQTNYVAYYPDPQKYSILRPIIIQGNSPRLIVENRFNFDQAVLLLRQIMFSAERLHASGRVAVRFTSTADYLKTAESGGKIAYRAFGSTLPIAYLGEKDAQGFWDAPGDSMDLYDVLGGTMKAIIPPEYANRKLHETSQLFDAVQVVRILQTGDCLPPADPHKAAKDWAKKLLANHIYPNNPDMAAEVGKIIGRMAHPNAAKRPKISEYPKIAALLYTDLKVLRFRLIEEVAANTEPAVEAATAPTGWLQRTLDAAGEFFGKLFSSSTVASLVKDLLPGSDKQHAAEFQLPRDPHQVLFKSVFSNSLFDDEKFNKVLDAVDKQKDFRANNRAARIKAAMKDILARAKLFKNDENRIAPLYLPSEFWSKQSPEDFLKALMILAEQELICTSVAFPGKLSEWQAKWNQMLKYPVWGELLEVPKKDYTGKELVQMLISVDLLPKEATEESLKYQRLGEGANGTVMKVTTKEGDFAVKKQFLNPTALKVNTFTLIIEGEFEFMILSQKINDARIFPLYSDKMQTLKHGVLTLTTSIVSGIISDLYKMAIGLDETLDVSVLKTPDGARTYLLQLLHAIKDHVRIWLDNNLLHRDIKMDNNYLTRTTVGTFDGGLVTRLLPGEYMSISIVSSFVGAPETKAKVPVFQDTGELFGWMLNLYQLLFRINTGGAEIKPEHVSARFAGWLPQLYPAEGKKRKGVMSTHMRHRDHLSLIFHSMLAMPWYARPNWEIFVQLIEKDAKGIRNDYESLKMEQDQARPQLNLLRGLAPSIRTKASAAWDPTNNLVATLPARPTQESGPVDRWESDDDSDDDDDAVAADLDDDQLSLGASEQPRQNDTTRTGSKPRTQSKFKKHAGLQSPAPAANLHRRKRKRPLAVSQSKKSKVLEQLMTMPVTNADSTGIGPSSDVEESEIGSGEEMPEAPIASQAVTSPRTYDDVADDEDRMLVDDDASPLQPVAADKVVPGDRIDGDEDLPDLQEQHRTEPQSLPAPAPAPAPVLAAPDPIPLAATGLPTPLTSAKSPYELTKDDHRHVDENHILAFTSYALKTVFDIHHKPQLVCKRGSKPDNQVCEIPEEATTPKGLRDMMLLGFQKIWLKPELKQEYADLLHWFETGWIPPVKLLFLLTALSRVFKIALRHPDEKARPFGNFLRTAFKEPVVIQLLRLMSENDIAQMPQVFKRHQKGQKE